MIANPPSRLQARAESPEVFYPGTDPVVVDASDVDRLARTALASPRKRARLCTHPTAEDALHEMIITLPREAYVRPHKHLGKTESFTVLQGEADLILFNDDGSVRQVIAMGPLDSAKPFYHRTARPVYHTLIVRSAHLVFHEVTSGPFRREQTVFPDWAPDGTDESAAHRFNARFGAVQP